MSDRLACTAVFLCASLCVVACGGDDGGQADTSSSTEGSSGGSGDPTTAPTSSAPTSDPTTMDPTTESSGAPLDTSSGTAVTDADSSSGTDTGEATQPVSIAFGATVGGEPFACGQSYAAVGNPPVEVEPMDLRFFVQDVRLVRADDGTEVPVVLDVVAPWQAETVALVDFEDATGACTEGNAETRTEITGVVPTGDYDGLVFTLGVPEDLNHADPLTLPPPLDAGTMTWGWLYGYKFLKVEVRQVVAEGVAGVGLLHLGSNGCTGVPGVDEVECSLPNRAEIRLESFDVAADTAVIDVAALFGETDLAVESMCHSAGEACPPLFDRVGVDLDTGLPSPTQIVFTAE